MNPFVAYLISGLCDFLVNLVKTHGPEVLELIEAEILKAKEALLKQ